MMTPEEYIKKIEEHLASGAKAPGASQQELMVLLLQLSKEYFSDLDKCSKEEVAERWNPFMSLIQHKKNFNELYEALEWPFTGGGAGNIIWGKWPTDILELFQNEERRPK